MQGEISSPPLRAVGYRRVSMKDQVDGFSLDAQENNIQRYIESRGWELVEIYVDAGISAKKGSHRPALERMLKEASQNKFDVIVVDKIDRFYRHLGGLLSTLDQLNGYGVSFASVQEQLDFTTPWGKLMLTVLGTLAEIYLDNLRQETRKGKLQQLRQGQWIGGVPYGYCHGLCSRCTDPNGKGYCPDFGQPDKSDGKNLVAHPVESQIVKLVFDLYVNHEESNRTIAEKLNGMQIPLPDGRSLPVRQKGAPQRTEPRPFTRDIVRDMVRRLAYTGKIGYRQVDSRGLYQKRRAPDQIFPGNHPALIDDETFQKAQEIRDIRQFNMRERKNKPVRLYPLTGTLRCGFCGGTMRGVSRVGGYHYYEDSNKQDRVCECQQKLVRADQIEQQVVKWLQSVVAGAISPEEWQAEQQATESEKRFERARELYLAGQITRTAYENEKLRLENVQSCLRNNDSHARITFVNEIRPQLELWPELSQFKRKRLLRLVLERAYLQENAFVAAEPTFAFQPLVRPYKVAPDGACNSGKGGIRTRG